ncbi:MAG: hypothetical protein ISS16_03505 [Ignavibacteria bacterium]|nr:hypothetical protein [Bacteroidota bacterium]MBL7128032.1 hypothetical protein [Ignavibacteria bacterium]
MKTDVKILLLSFLLIVFFQMNLYPNSYFTSFQGKWTSVDEDISLDLDLFQTGDELTGYHCSVTKHAQRIDCALESDDMGYSIDGIVKGNQANVTFLSTYCMKYGKAKIVMHGDYLYWEVTEFPDGEFWLPLSAILKRVDE